MKRSIFGGAVVMAAVLPGLMAQPRPKTQEEFDAVKAMFGAATADARSLYESKAAWVLGARTVTL